MKYVYSVLVLVVVVLAFGYFYPQNENIASWHQTELIDGYSEVWETDGCIILVYADGSGLSLVAHDRENNLVEHVGIKAGKIFWNSSEDDVFGEKYAVSAREQLPEKILKLFGNNWGIN